MLQPAASACKVGPSPDLETALLSGDQYKALPASTLPYLSAQAGHRMLRELGLSGQEHRLAEVLTRITDILRPFEIGLYQECEFFKDTRCIPEIKVSILDTELTVRYAGSGHFSSVYSVRGSNGTAYALKVFYQRNAEDFCSGPWSETALGVFVTEKRVSNMPHLCMAHPAKGWIVSEFVDSGYRSPSPDGPTWGDLGLEVVDVKLKDTNSISTDSGSAIRVDYGHMTTPVRTSLYGDRKLQETLEQLASSNGSIAPRTFLELYDGHPEWRTDLLGQLFRIDPRHRLRVAAHMLSAPEADFFAVQDYLANGLIPPKRTRALFDLLMRNPNPAVRAQAIFSVQKLSREDANYLGEQWYSRPEFFPFLVYMGKRDFGELEGSFLGLRGPRAQLL